MKDEKKKDEKKKKKNDDYSGPLTSLPVDLPKVDRLQRRRSCQNLNYSLMLGKLGNSYISLDALLIHTSDGKIFIVLSVSIYYGK